MRAVCATGLVALAWVGTPSASAEGGPCPEHSAWIEEIHCVAVKRGPDGESLLQPGPLCPGWQIRCQRADLSAELQSEPGYMVLVTGVGKTQRLTDRQSWTIVPPFQSGSGRFYRALKEHAAIGGRERSTSGLILWPGDAARISPDHAVLRWTPSPHGESLIVQFVNPADPLGGINLELDGSTGRHAGADLLEYLRQAQQAGTSELMLRASMGSVRSSLVMLQVITRDEQAKLDAALTEWERAPGVLGRVGRALELLEFKLYAEAAEEYEIALESAPERVDLLEKSAAIHREYGNRSRARELEARIASLAERR